MTTYWTERTKKWFRGYYVIAYELVNEYKDWELDPMCDTFGKTRIPSGKYTVVLYRTYATDKAVYTCHEHSFKADNLSNEDVEKFYNSVRFETPLMTAKGILEDIGFSAEAIRKVP